MLKSRIESTISKKYFKCQSKPISWITKFGENWSLFCLLFKLLIPGCHAMITSSAQWSEKRQAVTNSLKKWGYLVQCASNFFTTLQQFDKQIDSSIPQQDWHEANCRPDCTFFSCQLHSRQFYFHFLLIVHLVFIFDIQLKSFVFHFQISFQSTSSPFF